MITRRQLRKIHSENLPLHILEQDYIQALFLTELYLKSEDLVFKGGTYLKHALGLDRFSEDLYFTKMGGDDLLGALKNSAERMIDYGIETELNKLKEDKTSITARLRYKGPLYQGTERSMGNVNIEVSKRDDVFLTPEWVRLFFKYPEIRVVNSLCLKKEEILAEKLRALSVRTKGRDLYDVWFLLKVGIGIDKKLYERKMSVIGKKPNLEISITKARWDQDLLVLLERPPEFEMIKAEVITALEQIGIKVVIKNT